MPRGWQATSIHQGTYGNSVSSISIDGKCYLLNIASLHSLLTKSLFFICREKNATELKLKLDNEESNISAMEAEIASTLDELASIEKQSAEHKESEGAKKSQLLKQIAEAKNLADISEFLFPHQCIVITYFWQCSPIFDAVSITVKNAYELAQKNANDFSSLPDEELARQMKLLDEAEKDIIEDANRERDEIIEMEPLLEKLKFDFNSDIPLEEQKAAGMKFLHQHCQEFLKTAKAERREKIKAEKEAQLASLKAEEKAECELCCCKDDDLVMIDGPGTEVCNDCFQEMEAKRTCHTSQAVSNEDNDSDDDSYASRQGVATSGEAEVNENESIVASRPWNRGVFSHKDGCEGDACKRGACIAQRMLDDLHKNCKGECMMKRWYRTRPDVSRFSCLVDKGCEQIELLFKQFDNLPRPIPNAINEESDTSNRVVERQSRDDDNKTYMCAELKVVEGTIICGLQGGAAQNSHNEGFDALIRKCLEYRELWLEQSSEERGI